MRDLLAISHPSRLTIIFIFVFELRLFCRINLMVILLYLFVNTTPFC
jgi:hypothetical protein